MIAVCDFTWDVELGTQQATQVGVKYQQLETDQQLLVRLQLQHFKNKLDNEQKRYQKISHDKIFMRRWSIPSMTKTVYNYRVLKYDKRDEFVYHILARDLLIINKQVAHFWLKVNFLQ